MNSASLWRSTLGRQIGMAYAANPKARVVMVAGSTGRGSIVPAAARRDTDGRGLFLGSDGLAARLLEDGCPVGDARPDAQLFNREPDHVLEHERAGGDMYAHEITPQVKARLQMDVRERFLDDVRMPVEREEFLTCFAENKRVEVVNDEDTPPAPDWCRSVLGKAVTLTHAKAERRESARQRNHVATGKRERQRRRLRPEPGGAQHISSYAVDNSLLDGDVPSDRLARTRPEQEAREQLHQRFWDDPPSIRLSPTGG